MKSAHALRDGTRWFSDAASLRQPMVKTISATQQFAGPRQVLGTAAALVAMCDGVGLDAHDVINQIHRAKSNLDSPFAAQWQAMVEYAKGELLNG